MKASDNTKFVEIKQNQAIERILEVVVKHKITITLWLKDQPERFETRAVLLSHDTQRILMQFPVIVNEKEFVDSLGVQGTDTVLGSFQAESLNFFFKSDFLQRTSEGYIEVRVPARLFKLQRRSNVRIPFKRNEAPKVSVFNPTLEYDAGLATEEANFVSYRILDVSAGGLAFAAPIEHADKLKNGMTLHNISFRLKTTPVESEGKIAYLNKTVNDRGQPMLKVGVQFVGLTAQHEKTLVQFALEESRKLFSLLY